MLSDVFDPRHNSLNAIRLLLALLVIVSHAWPLLGYDFEPNFGGLKLGTWAVVGFFGISGFLITRSRLSNRPTRDFWAARALRILPGLTIALLIVAFVFAPIGAALQTSATWSPISSITYVVRNIALYPQGFSQYSIEKTLIGFPYRDWDGPLWTLFWEGVSYAAIGIGVSVLGRGRVLQRTVLAVFLLCTAVAIVHVAGRSLSDVPDRVLPLATAFAAGALLTLGRDRIPVRPWTIALALALTFGSIALGAAPAIAPLPVTFLLLLLSTVLPLRQIGAKFDVSYGVYIYAWPIQQLAILIFGRNLPVALMIGLVAIGTLPLAFLSCAIVERPALRFKQRVPHVVAVPQRPRRLNPARRDRDA